MAFTFAAFAYIVALVVDAILIFFAIFHVSLRYLIMSGCLASFEGKSWTRKGFIMYTNCILRKAILKDNKLLCCITKMQQLSASFAYLWMCRHLSLPEIIFSVLCFSTYQVKICWMAWDKFLGSKDFFHSKSLLSTFDDCSGIDSLWSRTKSCLRLWDYEHR